MAKDPAFLFYYQDFLVGTAFMSNEQCGAYIRILCHMADKGTMTEEHMMIICNCQNIFDAIIGKFERRQDGRIFHKRIQAEVEKRRKYVESRKNNRSAGEKISSSYDQHMENENDNANQNPTTTNISNVPQKSREIFDLWNEFAGKQPKLRKAKVLNKSRAFKIQTRLKEELFDFKLILQAIEQQTFLINGNPNSEKHSAWRVDLDWIIHNDTNYIKVLEFKYADPDKPMPTKSRSQIEWENTQKYLTDLAKEG